MKTFSQIREETSSYEIHKKRVQKIPKGSDVSFTQAKTGKTVTGKYNGLKQMSGRSYAHVEHGDGATYVPVHQIHESVEALDESSYEMHKKRVQGIKKGSDVSFTHATSGKKVTGKYQGLKQQGGRSYAHVEHGTSATYVPVHQIHESEQLDEISVKKMTDYQDKSSDDHSRSINRALTAGSSRKAEPYYARASRREDGIDRADRLISKKVAESLNSDQLAEISTAKLSNYVNRGYADIAKHYDAAHDARHNKGDSAGAVAHDLAARRREKTVDKAHEKLNLRTESTADTKNTHNWYDMSTVADKHLDKIDDSDQSTFTHSGMISDEGDSGYHRPDNHLGVLKTNRSANSMMVRYGATKID